MIFGIGIDTIEVSRIAKQLSEDERFTRRVFTEREIEYCEGMRHAAEHYAARFAAKEALLKALGTGLRGPMKWTDMEVLKDDVGRPEIRVSGHVRELVEQTGPFRIHVSLTHINETASAVIIIETQDTAAGETKT